MSVKKPAIISVHDVMPDTLGRVEHLLTSLLQDVPNEHVLLLVVPGLSWSADQINTLKQWQQNGYEIAGHGWLHQVDQIRTSYHRLHSYFLSRNAAEHLSKTAGDLKQLLIQNRQWFSEHEFQRPRFYVPPAWALGSVRRTTLFKLGFTGLETTRGICSLADGRTRLLPLVGFEADTASRALWLRLWNRVNFIVARKRRPVRISIHPFDDDYRLANQMRQMIAVSQSVHWQSILPLNKAMKDEKNDKSHIEIL